MKKGIIFSSGLLLAAIAFVTLAPVNNPPTPGVAVEVDPIASAVNGILKSNGTTLSAAVAGTDYATTVQAAHSGGVIGTASFAGGDPVSSFVSDGVITAAAYSTPGVYLVTITEQANSNYIPLVSCNEVTNGVTANVIAKTNTSITLMFYDPRSEVLVEPTIINVAVLRLSQ